LTHFIVSKTDNKIPVGDQGTSFPQLISRGAIAPMESAPMISIHESDIIGRTINILVCCRLNNYLCKC